MWMDDDGYVIAGSTSGNWTGINKGRADFMAVKLDASNRTESWSWQVRLDAIVFAQLGVGPFALVSKDN